VSYDFNLTAAINGIAALEDAITLPAPGIVTSYTYGANPVEFTAGSQLPAVVHMPTGPVAEASSEITHGSYGLFYDIISRLLIVEAVPDQYPGDDSGAALFWKAIMDKMLTNATRLTLCSASGAFSYALIFQAGSYAIRPWPPVETAGQHFWSLEYIHRFTMIGG
jgi:hypothetical protein